jgi:hypothetical protein
MTQYQTIQYKLTAKHSLPEYDRFNFDDEVIKIKTSPFFNEEETEKFYWSSKLGCSKDYDTPEECIRQTCFRHGVKVLKLERI